MKCTHPNLCIQYMEITNPNIPAKIAKGVCTKHDFDVNFHNQDKIDNCQDHKTYEQRREEWNKFKNGNNNGK